MTTQTAKVSLMGPDSAIVFTGTCTDDQWNEVKSEVGSVSLGKVMNGKVIDKADGYYTAGGGVFRIRNLKSFQVKVIMALPIITEEKVTQLEEPIIVELEDVVEIFTVAVPT